VMGFILLTASLSWALSIYPILEYPPFGGPSLEPASSRSSLGTDWRQLNA